MILIHIIVKFLLETNVITYPEIHYVNLPKCGTLSGRSSGLVFFLSPVLRATFSETNSVSCHVTCRKEDHNKVQNFSNICSPNLVYFSIPF